MSGASASPRQFRGFLSCHFCNTRRHVAPDRPIATDDYLCTLDCETQWLGPPLALMIYYCTTILGVASTSITQRRIQHILSIHLQMSSSPSYICRYCKEGFHESSQKTYHERNKCPEKSYTYDHPQLGSIPYMRAANNNLLCPHCEKSFAALKSVKAHLDRAHPDLQNNVSSDHITANSPDVWIYNSGLCYRTGQGGEYIITLRPWLSCDVTVI